MIYYLIRPLETQRGHSCRWQYLHSNSFWIIIIKSFYSLWSIGHPWRASRHCDLQLFPWHQSMIFVHFMPKGLPLVSGCLLFISVSFIIMFKVCLLLACSTRSQWWGCHLSLWAGRFSVGVSSPSLWRSSFATRQWCWLWSTLGILFPQYPPYLVSLPLSATWRMPDGRPATPHGTF